MEHGWKYPDESWNEADEGWKNTSEGWNDAQARWNAPMDGWTLANGGWKHAEHGCNLENPEKQPNLAIKDGSILKFVFGSGYWFLSRRSRNQIIVENMFVVCERDAKK
ncbi:MAG: hypothetical protein ABSE90_11760 [Verrucomicrobiota bacterium]|jgi:hypothetical protein